MADPLPLTPEELRQRDQIRAAVPASVIARTRAAYTSFHCYDIQIRERGGHDETTGRLNITIEEQKRFDELRSALEETSAALRQGLQEQATRLGASTRIVESALNAIYIDFARQLSCPLARLDSPARPEQVTQVQTAGHGNG